MSKILVLNGPNLNLLGSREPEIYGAQTLDDINASLAGLVQANGFDFDSFQSNGEQALVDRLHQAAGDGTGFIIINPAALTHTSIALRDAFLGISIPFIEVHLSNIFSREEFRHKSYLSDIAAGCIFGLGAKGYELAVEAAIEQLKSKG